MMHFAIPDIENLKDKNNTNYTSYVIYLNGIPHSSLRYRRIRKLFENIKSYYGHSIDLPQFPPKNILMSDYEIEDRRDNLEKYFQTLAQMDIISNSQIQYFFRDAQKEFHQRLGTFDNFTSCQKKENIDYSSIKRDLTDGNPECLNENLSLLNNENLYQLPVYYSIMPIKKSINIKILSCYQDILKSKMDTNSILKESLKQLNIPEKYISFFTLYIVRVETTITNQNYLIYINQLTNLENPFLTIKSLQYMKNFNHKDNIYVYLHTNYWDTELYYNLKECAPALSIIFYQMMNEGNYHNQPQKEPRKLDVLSKYQHDEVAREVYESLIEEIVINNPMHGYVWLKQPLGTDGFPKKCVLDYPHEDTRGDLWVGMNGILFVTGNGDVDSDSSSLYFKTSRIKSWRVTSFPIEGSLTSQANTLAVASHSFTSIRHYGPRVAYKFSFQYLVSDQELRWIAIQCDHPLFLSSCLQGVVKDMLRFEQPIDSINSSPPFKRESRLSDRINKPQPLQTIMKCFVDSDKQCRTMPFPEFIQLKECVNHENHLKA